MLKIYKLKEIVTIYLLLLSAKYGCFGKILIDPHPTVTGIIGGNLTFRVAAQSNLTTSFVSCSFYNRASGASEVFYNSKIGEIDSSFQNGRFTATNYSKFRFDIHIHSLKKEDNGRLTCKLVPDSANNTRATEIYVDDEANVTLTIMDENYTTVPNDISYTTNAKTTIGTSDNNTSLAIGLCVGLLSLAALVIIIGVCYKKKCCFHKKPTTPTDPTTPPADTPESQPLNKNQQNKG